MYICYFVAISLDWIFFLPSIIFSSLETIQRLQAEATGVGVVRLTWLAAPNTVMFNYYLVSYRPISHSNGGSTAQVLSNTVVQDGRVTYTLRQLLNFTTYSITVQLSCDQGLGTPATSVVSTLHTSKTTSIGVVSG